MNQGKSIGIAFTVYNGGRWLGDLFDSISKQSVIPDEISIVDNGSTDDTLFRVKEGLANLKDLGVDGKLTELKKNAGSTTGYNLAISQLESDIVVLTGADDIFHINRLSELAQKHCQGHGFVFSAFSYFGEKNLTLRSPSTFVEIILSMLFVNVIGAITVSLDTSVIPKSEITFAHHREGADDYALWVHLLTLGVVPSYIDKVLMYYRIHQSQVTRQVTSSKTISSVRLVQRDLFLNLFGDAALNYTHHLLKDIAGFLNKEQGVSHSSKIPDFPFLIKIIESHKTSLNENLGAAIDIILKYLKNEKS